MSGRALLIALSALFCGCRGEVPERAHFNAFDGEAMLELPGVSAARAKPIVASVGARLESYGRDWHAWHPGALMDINAALARGERAYAPASVRDLVRRAQPLAARSDHLFDPAIGGLIRLWGFHTDHFPVRTPLPEQDAIDTWLSARPRLSDVSIDDDVLLSRNPAVQLDFGAMAEGVASEEIARLLAEYGVRDALLSLGGDLYALGRKDGEPWAVGLRDPYGGVLAQVQLDGPEALFSSGAYNKFREAPSGARWPHVLDPRIGQPVQGTTAVAVLYRDPVLADVAATALMVGGPARFTELIDRLGVHCALLLTEENEMMITTAMLARLVFEREPVRLGRSIGTPGGCSR